jgi:pimeloyl-ACP methyl ester carboxylesterase
MHIVKHHPDWFHAYIGVGQVVCLKDNEQAVYERLLAHAREQNETELAAKLEALIPMLGQESPAREKFAIENSGFVRTELSRLAGETLMHHTLWDNFLKIWNLDRTISPHLTLADLSNDIVGDDIAYNRPPYYLLKDYFEVDLPKDIGFLFEVPIFFFSGRHDFQVPVTLSDQWFSEIEAPHKALIHFEESSHMIVNEEPGKVLMALVNQVLPFAQSKSNHGIEK